MERFVINLLGTSRYIVSFYPLRTTSTIGGRPTKKGVTQRAMLFYSEQQAFQEIQDYLSSDTCNTRRTFQMVSVAHRSRR